MGCRHTDTDTGVEDLASFQIMAYVSWSWSATKDSNAIGRYNLLKREDEMKKGRRGLDDFTSDNILPD